MNFEEVLYEKKLHINTTGRDDSCSDDYSFPYEPTDYPVLERLAESGYINKENHLIDYGCGKGRVSFFINYRIGCRCTGIECMEKFYQIANENANAYHGKNVSFINERAEKYIVPHSADCFFFFNPFSIEIMQGVMQRIIDSYYEAPRQMRFFFYFPQAEYVAFLMQVDELEFLDEIDCRDLFEEKSDRNRIMIFQTEAEGI